MKQTIARLLVAGFDGTTLPPLMKKLVADQGLGGVILFSRNIENPPQVKKLNQQIRKLSSHSILIGVDQEGGLVARLKKPFTTIPPMSQVGAYYKATKDAATVREVGHILGREVSAVGFNWDYAPVVDVHSNPKNPIIGNRAFGPDPLLVSQCAAQLMKGLHAEGVLSCLKHFPGHGATHLDSHKELPILKTSGRVLWKRDVVPYRHLIPSGLVWSIMTAHVKYTDWDKNNCATLSEEIISNLLRKRLKYKRLVVSDDLWMKAIADRIGLNEAAIQFLSVGGDVVLVCHQPEVIPDMIEAIFSQAEKSSFLQKRIREAAQRMKRVQKRFAFVPRYPLSVIGCSKHTQLIEKINHFNLDRPDEKHE